MLSFMMQELDSKDVSDDYSSGGLSDTIDISRLQKAAVLAETNINDKKVHASDVLEQHYSTSEYL